VKLRRFALSVNYPWWFWAAFAIFIGFGSAQDEAKQLGSSTGVHLVFRWSLVVIGAAIFLTAGWVAIEKFRARDIGERRSSKSG
jgi:hypothetical protein